VVKTGNIEVPDLERLVISQGMIDKFEIDRIELTAMCFQTGYLTIKKEEGYKFVLGYPNFEVRQSWFENLLATLNDNQQSRNESILERMKRRSPTDKQTCSCSS
jgi:hypothetical protein